VLDAIEEGVIWPEHSKPIGGWFRVGADYFFVDSWFEAGGEVIPVDGNRHAQIIAHALIMEKVSNRDANGDAVAAWAPAFCIALKMTNDGGVLCVARQWSRGDALKKFR